MAAPAADINAHFEQIEKDQQAAAGAASSGTDAGDKGAGDKTAEEKLLDDTGKAATDAGKTGGSQIPDDVAKELEELRRYKQENPLKQPDETAEQKAEREKQYSANLHKFAFDKGIYSPDDLGKIESLKTQADTDIVFNGFKENFKGINPAATDEEIKEAFDAHYHTNSDNEHLKKLGESRIQQEANNYRNPYNSKLETAKKEFDTQLAINSKVPEFEGFLQKVIKDHSPENWSVFKTKDGEEEVPVNFQLTEADRKKAFDVLRKSDNFELFLGGDPAKAEEYVQKQLEAYYRLEHNDKINKTIFDMGVSRGTKKGSTTGAENAFPIASEKNKTQQSASDTLKELEESDTRLREHRRTHG